MFSSYFMDSSSIDIDNFSGFYVKFSMSTMIFDIDNLNVVF